ncbi:MAG: hypothetical protein ACI9WU_002774 [Myxococcota bacterium]|jgi:hypothetical protein
MVLDPVAIRQILTFGFVPSSRVQALRPGTPQLVGDGLLAALARLASEGPQTILDDGSPGAAALSAVAQHIDNVTVLPVNVFGPEALEQALPGLVAGLEAPVVRYDALAGWVTAVLHGQGPVISADRDSPSAARSLDGMGRPPHLRLTSLAEPLARLRRRAFFAQRENTLDIDHHRALLEPALLSATATWDPQAELSQLTMRDAAVPFARSIYMEPELRGVQIDDRALAGIASASGPVWRPPLGDWLAGPLIPLLQSRLDPTKIRRQAQVKAEHCEAMIAEHRKRWRDHTATLWTMLVLQTWNEL